MRHHHGAGQPCVLGGVKAECRGGEREVKILYCATQRKRCLLLYYMYEFVCIMFPWLPEEDASRAQKIAIVAPQSCCSAPKPFMQDRDLS